MSILLGVCTHKDEVPKTVAENEVSNKIGSVFFTLGCGFIAFFMYPDVSSTFYLLGMGGVCATSFILLIPSDAIDDDRARQLDKAEGDDEEKARQLDKAEGDDEEKELQKTTVTYSALLMDKNIRMFAILTFVYHLGNAAVVPLTAQYIAIGEPKTSMIFTSATLLLFYMAQAPTAWYISANIDKMSVKTALIFGQSMLPVRCLLLAMMCKWYDNPYLIVSTQLLDGIGAGIYDTMVPIIVSKMTEGTGHFGFTYGFIVTCWRVGHGFSLLVAESIVHLAGHGEQKAVSGLTVCGVSDGVVGTVDEVGRRYWGGVQ